MRISRIEIEEFGKLTALDLSLHEGINLIEGKNESGKSTLLAFLRFVLYGFPRRSGANADERDKRLSWHTKRAAGTLTLEKEGQTYRIRRELFLRGGTARETASESLSVICAESNERVALDGKTPGEFFLGLPAELYDSSLCLAQSDAERVADPTVREALGDLLFSSGSTLCAEDAEKRLDDARRTLKHNRGVGGRIAQLTAEKTRLDNEISRAAEDAERLAEIRENIHRCRTKIENSQNEEQRLTDALEYTELKETIDLFEQKSRAVSERERCAIALERVKNTLDALPNRDVATHLAVAVHDVHGAREELSHLTPELEQLTAVTHDQALLDAATYIERKGAKTLFEETQRQQKAIKSRTVCALILFLLAATSISLGMIIPVLFVVGGVLLIAAAILAIGAILAKNTVGKVLAHMQISHVAMLRTRIEACESAKAEFDTYQTRLTALRAAEQNAVQRERDAFERLTKEFAPFGKIDNDFSLQDAAALLREINERRSCTEAELANATLALERAKERVEGLAARLQALDEESIRSRLSTLPAPTQPPEPLKEKRALLARERTELTTRLGDLERAEAALAATSHDPHALMRERAKINEELHQANARLAAIEMAMTAMEEASEDLRRGITPKLRADAANMFAALTAREEDALILGQDFSLSISVNGQPQPLSRFSAGCRDAAHLSLRLALLATLSDERLPLFFDEAFARLDDERTKTLLELLVSYADLGGQVLLFTCHSREREMLAGNKTTCFTL